MTATVLLVEDERKLRELVRSYLERAGFSVLSTESGAEAISVALIGRMLARGTEAQELPHTPPLPLPGLWGAPSFPDCGSFRIFTGKDKIRWLERIEHSRRSSVRKRPRWWWSRPALLQAPRENSE